MQKLMSLYNYPDMNLAEMYAENDHVCYPKLVLLDTKVQSIAK